MEKFINSLKAAGVQIDGEPIMLSNLVQAENFQQAILGLSRQGRSIGITFSSNPMQLNAPAVVETLKEAGFDDVQVEEFFANTSTQYSAKEIRGIINHG